LIVAKTTQRSLAGERALEHRMQIGADPGFETGGGDGCGHESDLLKPSCGELPYLATAIHGMGISSRGLGGGGSAAVLHACSKPMGGVAGTGGCSAPSEQPSIAGKKTF
jgi:hypothetical protein